MRQYEHLHRRLLKVLRADDGDNVRIYQLCWACVRTIEIIGVGEIEQMPDVYVV
jgi:CRISPR/Cas system-associated endoribonuclease Cas2